MLPPILIRRQIPFFHDKSEAEFRNDPYERYDEMVVRQTALHLADALWGGYPFQPIWDWVAKNLPVGETGLPEGEKLEVADIGCGVGRLAGEMAKEHPEGQVWGIDHSYQMLRRAHEFWVEGKTLELDWTSRGMRPMQLDGSALANLKLGLAKAEKLPFDDNSLDVATSTFLLDRLEDPAAALREMHRVLKFRGRLLLVSPLNFQLAQNWKRFHPGGRLIDFLQKTGWKIESWRDDWEVREPMDARGNSITWRCVGVVAEKV